MNDQMNEDWRRDQRTQSRLDELRRDIRWALRDPDIYLSPKLRAELEATADSLTKQIDHIVAVWD